LGSGTAQAAEDIDTTLAQLQAQLTALQQQVNALKQKKQASTEASETAQLTAQDDASAEAQEENTEHSFATQSELAGCAPSKYFPVKAPKAKGE